MSHLSRCLLATASLAALFAGAGHAMAQVAINGGGSTLAYPTYLQIFSDVVDNSNRTFGNKTTSHYGSVGSGKGTTGFLNNDDTQDNGGTVPPVANFTTGTTIHYGASDATLTSRTRPSGCRRIPTRAPAIRSSGLRT